MRIWLVLAGSPNCVLLIFVIQLWYVTWFKTFCASTLRSILKRSPQGNVLPSVPVILNCVGPVMEFRAALPHWPGAGAWKAAGFRKSPAGAAVMEAPVALGRRFPDTPVPGTSPAIVGVC